MAMEEAGPTPADCRRMRESAQVSIHELARILHRDPSSLSRWERGLQVPRDVDVVIAAYLALEPLPDGSQPIRTIAFRVRPRIVVLLGARWVVLALVVAIGAEIGKGEIWAADVLRVFIVGGAGAAIALMVLRFRRLHRRATTSTGGQLIVVSWALAIGFCALYHARHLGETEMHVGLTCWALLAVEVALVGLAWRIEEPLTRRTP